MTERTLATFERIPETTSNAPTDLAGLALELGKLSMDFARVERVPRYADGRRESDVEHSYMLALVAPELAHALDIGLDAALVHQYATVHDLIEVKTGDVATFMLSNEQLKQKEQTEMDALEDLLLELPPYNRDLVSRYEAQADPESRFVRAIDKLLPIIVDIHGDGDRVMREDYGITDKPAFEAAHDAIHGKIARRFNEFPDVVEAHGLLCELYGLETQIGAAAVNAALIATP